MGELAWRLRALETTAGKMEARMTQGFSDLSTQISGLTFVRLDVYEVEKAGLMRELRALQERVDTVRSHSTWASALIAAPVIGAVVVAVGRLL